MEYYLSSLESYKLNYVRKCTFEKEIYFNTGKKAIIAKVDEIIQWQDASGFKCSEYVIITNRYENDDISDIREFPMFVYVCVLKENTYFSVDEICKEDLLSIGLGELYRTRKDAEQHKFD